MLPDFHVIDRCGFADVETDLFFGWMCNSFAGEIPDFFSIYVSAQSIPFHRETEGMPVVWTEFDGKRLGFCLEQCNEFGVVLLSGTAFSYFEIHAAGLHVGQSEASLTYREAAEMTCMDTFTISIGKLNPDTFLSR